MTLAPAPSSPAQSPEAQKTPHNTYGKPPGRRHFWIRRVHSLMGLVFGGYIATHLLVNASAVMSPQAFQLNVDKIHSLEPMLWLIELSVIFIPLLLHAAYGIYITWAGVKFNTTKYAYGGNLRYTLQRWTAVFLLAFLAFHIGTLHRWGLAGVHNVIERIHPAPLDAAKEDAINHFSDWCGQWGGLFTAKNQAFQSTVSGVHTFWDSQNVWAFGNWVVMVFYFLAIWAATFHFANGLWTSAIAWGVTITRDSQRRWGHFCFGFFILLTVVGMIAWYAFTINPAANGETSRWDKSTLTHPTDELSDQPDNGEAPAATNP